jgi:hypothetical protein
VKNTFARYNERMREQIDRIEQDKEWLVRMKVCREQSVGRFRRGDKP